VDRYDRANAYDPLTKSLVAVGTGGLPRSGFESDRNNWAPRIGIAWSPGAGNRTVIHTGYGIYYDHRLSLGEDCTSTSPITISSCTSRCRECP